jgi:GDP-L-fucose synthase
MSRVFVTGATGYLGRALVERLRREGHEVTGVGSKDADLTREGTLERFSTPKVDRIFHLAAWTQAGDFCLSHSADQWLINQAMNTHVLAWWHARQPQAKLISIGTSCSYAPDLPLQEAWYLKGEPIEDLRIYAMTKRMLLIGQESLSRQYGLKYLTVVPSTLYGPGYHVRGKQPHFIFDLIRKILAFRSRGEPAILWGTGEQRRELVYVDDFISALFSLVDTVDNDLVNIGAGEDYSIREFAGMICELTGVDPSAIRYDRDRYVGAASKKLDVAKLRTLLPGRSVIPLREGLQKTIAWMQANPE